MSLGCLISDTMRSFRYLLILFILVSISAKTVLSEQAPTPGKTGADRHIPQFVPDDWPNDAEKDEAGQWLVCCDQLGHFYAKWTEDLRSIAGIISADGRRWIRERYCTTNPHKERKPTFNSCVTDLVLEYGTIDLKSMYADE